MKKDYRLKKQRVHASLWVKEIEKLEEAKQGESGSGGADDIDRLLDSCSELGKQRLQEARTLPVDYMILLFAGICLGTLAKVSEETFGAMGYTYTVIVVSLLCKITALRSFSLDKLHYWRESRAGMSSLAYFLEKDTIDHFNTIVKPLVYLSMFYFFNNPRSTVTDNYIVLICLVYCVTRIAYALAICPGQWFRIATDDRNQRLCFTS